MKKFLQKNRVVLVIYVECSWKGDSIRYPPHPIHPKKHKPRYFNHLAHIINPPIHSYISIT